MEGKGTWEEDAITAQHRKAFYMKAFPPINPHERFYKPQSKSASMTLCRPKKWITSSMLSSTGTMSGGQFDWGGRLLKSNGGAQRLAQMEWKPIEECKGKSQLDCETYKSSRDESRA